MHSDISNSEKAESSSSVKDGYISPEDYEHILQTLIDPNRATGLKVVVSTEEISKSDIDQEGLRKILKEADENVARYADISLIVVALDNGEYLGSLHKTDNPIELAMAIPEDLLAAGNPVYVLRLHDGKKETAVEIYHISEKTEKENDISAKSGEESEISTVKNSTSGVSAKTGDASDATLWMVILVLATGALLVTAFAKKTGKM